MAGPIAQLGPRLATDVTAVTQQMQFAHRVKANQQMPTGIKNHKVCLTDVILRVIADSLDIPSTTAYA